MEKGKKDTMGTVSQCVPYWLMCADSLAERRCYWSLRHGSPSLLYFPSDSLPCLLYLACLLVVPFHRIEAFQGQKCFGVCVCVFA